MSKRILNFYPGPCTLPFEKMQDCYDKTLNYNNSGMSLWEISHRTPHYEAEVHDEAIRLMHEVYRIPTDTHRVLMLGGGGTLQFAMIPMNFLKEGTFAEYASTGFWSQKAIADAKLIGDARVIVDGEDSNYFAIPKDFTVNPDAQYFYLTTNNTIVGTEWADLPDTGNVPIVADMSSNILSKPVDWSRVGLAFAGLTKNLGPAGMAVVIVRKDLIETANRAIPAYLRYDIHDEHNSLYNTPPMFCIYLMKSMLEWTRDNGGLDQMNINADIRAKMIYDVIDRYPEYYHCPAANEDRSRMNVRWHMPTPELEQKFVQEATDAGMVGLGGHFLVGHCRASIYNFMPIDHVKALCEFMVHFMEKNPV